MRTDEFNNDLDIGAPGPSIAPLASPEAGVLAQVVLPNLSERGHIDLHLLLGARRAFPTPAASRRRRLAVILDFIHARGRRPLLPEYVRESDRLRATGVDAPSLRQLYGWFGSWPNAVSLAARYFERGTAARVPFRAPTKRRRGSITETMLLDSIEAVFDELGYWPGDQDYFGLLNAEEVLRSKLGASNVRLFSISAFNGTFGSYGDARAAARRRVDSRKRLRDHDPGPMIETGGSRPRRPQRLRARSSRVSGPQ